jgi:hypothetical protein
MTFIVNDGRLSYDVEHETYTSGLFCQGHPVSKPYMKVTVLRIHMRLTNKQCLHKQHDLEQ